MGYIAFFYHNEEFSREPTMPYIIVDRRETPRLSEGKRDDKGRGRNGQQLPPTWEKWKRRTERY
jgi:hypothetical protein